MSATVAAGPVPAPGGVLPAFFLSGFVALALEAVWNRFFAMYFGSSIYSYAVILCLYLVGIVAGGMVFGRLERRGLPPVRVFAACLLLLVADLAVTVPLMDRILYVQLAALDVLGLGFTAFQLANVAAACLVILPPTILFGVSFPAVAAAASRGVERLGSELGFVYLVNTAGTTAGALVASFLLIPGLGVRGSLDLLVGVAAAALVVTAPRFRVAAVALGLAVLPVVTAWDLRLMHTLVSKEPGIVLRIWRDGGLGRTLDAINVLEARDGVDATVSVAEYYGRSRSLLVNGKPDASADKDLLTQAMLGHLPLLLHPSPREALVVGMGSGVTLAAVARHPVATIDLVEISAEVLDLGDRYFREVNRGALHDPRVAVHVEDGRNFIAFTPGRTYDVIVSEPSNPWMTGVSNLFTAEYFAQVRQRLRPGGILCQWFHYYSMTLADVRTLIGTLRGHFSHVYAFAYQESGASGDLVLLASEAALDFAPVLAAIGGAGPAGPDLRALGLHEPEQFLDALMLSPENVDRFVAGAPVNSDDVPRIELRAPRAIFEDTALANLRAFLTASGGARLPVRPEGPAEGPFRLGGLEVVPPPGFHLRSSGIRIETGAPDADGLVARDAVREITLEASGGRRLAALGAPAMLDRAGLDRLAALASGAPAVFDGAATTAGHPALRYRSGTPPGVVLVWSCPETAASYAVSVSAGPEAATEATGARCHHP